MQSDSATPWIYVQSDEFLRMPGAWRNPRIFGFPWRAPSRYHLNAITRRFGLGR